MTGQVCNVVIVNEIDLYSFFVAEKVLGGYNYLAKENYKPPFGYSHTCILTSRRLKVKFLEGFFMTMKNVETQLASHKIFGQLRFFKTDDGEIWFVGKDVAEILGYKDTKSAIIDHVDDDDKMIVNQKKFQKIASESKGGETPPPKFDSPRGLMFINESGLYSLILSSKLPKAKEFKRWVTSEVLPSIRKYGYYDIHKQEKNSAFRFAIYEGNGEGEIGQMYRLEVNGEPVVTTAQLAKFFDCSTQSIRKTFHIHKEQFIEGVHFYKLEGDALKNFKRNVTESNLVTNGNLPFVNPSTPHLMLWTALGAAKFAKSLKSRRAWDIYEQLAVNYFKTLPDKKSAKKNSNGELTPKEKIKFLLQAAKITKDATRRENLLSLAEKIIVGKNSRGR